MTFQRQEQVYGRLWSDRDLVGVALENLCPALYTAVTTFLYPRLDQVHPGEPLPVSLQLSQLGRTIKATLRRMRSPELMTLPAAQSQRPRQHGNNYADSRPPFRPYCPTNQGSGNHGTIHAITNDPLSDPVNHGMDDPGDAIVHAVSNRDNREPRYCEICEATSHSTDSCFRIENWLFAKAPLTIPSHLKAPIQARLRILADNLAKIKPPSPSAPGAPTTQQAVDNSLRRQIIRSLLNQDPDVDVPPDDDPSNDHGIDSPGTATMHLIGLVDHPNITQDFDVHSTGLQCHAVDVSLSPLGAFSDIVHSYCDMAPVASPDTSDDTHGTRAQVDDGSNTTTTDQLRLLWQYKALDEPKYVRDAGGRDHKAIGMGFLMVPTTATTNVEPIMAYFTPSIAATIISPGGTCHQKRQT